MVIDENGEQLGIMDTLDALDLATNRGFDLVEVSPLANPPVCKIIDYGKFQYQQSRSSQKAKKVDTKGIRLSLSIGQHDLEVKQKQVNKFLSKGHNVQIELRLRGRERAFRAKALQVIKDFLEKIEVEYKMDKNIQQQGSIISALISKK
ncbi:translation initiation factor IF-3 [Patescibacteria group bacterium]|nr:translation initiation factor IF-3 [Patescibacteria group bacterium]